MPQRLVGDIDAAGAALQADANGGDQRHRDQRHSTEPGSVRQARARYAEITFSHSRTISM